MTADKLTQKKLQQELLYNPETGVFRNRYNRANNAVKAGSITGSKRGKHIQIYANGTLYYAHRLAWLYYYGAWPEGPIDHINQEQDDNRIINLRVVSASCNSRNVKVRTNSVSGVKGVTWDGHKWRVHIYAYDKNHFIGGYKDIENAICARLMAEQCLDWKGCETTSSAYLHVSKWLKGQKV